MKLLRDVKTGEVFINVHGNDSHAISVFDQRVVEVCNFTFEEISVKPKDTNLRYQRIIDDSLSIGCLEENEFHLKDIIYVPVDGKEIPFRVEHISDDRVYFVAVDCVGRSNMNNMREFLDRFMEKMPEELVCKILDIEHCVDGKTSENKLSLLSYGNLVECDRCTGKDEFVFDGLKTEAERCKNTDGETDWYFTDTPYAGYSANFMYVYISGYPGSYGANTPGGVVPCFAIRKRSE